MIIFSKEIVNDYFKSYFNGEFMSCRMITFSISPWEKDCLHPYSRADISLIDHYHIDRLSLYLPFIMTSRILKKWLVQPSRAIFFITENLA